LDKNIKSVAVIGIDAEEARPGGYSGPGNKPVSILQGIKNMVGTSCKINYSPGCGREKVDFVTIPTENLYYLQDGKKESGLKGEYYNNASLDGEPVLIRMDPKLDFGWTLFSPDQKKINYDCFSVRWTGKLMSSATGNFDIGIQGDDGYRLYIDEAMIIDNWRKQTFQLRTKEFYFEKGKSYDIKVEFYETVGNVRIKLVWNNGLEKDWENEINQAVEIARQSDVAIVVAGIEEGEFRDRAYLSLPGHQEEMILKVAATGKPVVVVLVGGSAITMNTWLSHVSSIIDVWYPGDEGGNAVADVLFGDYNPAGRLPITFPVHESQLPLVYNHKPTGRGDDYVNLTGKPLFPFGYGLSYSTFEYSNLKIDKPAIKSDESTLVSFYLKNTGNYDGEEVVQLYIKDLFASVARPVMELKGFQRIRLKKGESKKILFEITPDLISMFDAQMNQIVEPGEFRLMIGASSNDIRLREILKVEE
jgi:beta-glucosidase